MRRPLASYVRGGLLALAALSLAGYSYAKLAPLLAGPVIRVEAPENGATVERSFIEVRGEAKNVAAINLNGRRIFTDEDGAFAEQLLLSYGHNIITLKASDRFGRETGKVLEIVYK